MIWIALLPELRVTGILLAEGHITFIWGGLMAAIVVAQPWPKNSKKIIKVKELI